MGGQGWAGSSHQEPDGSALQSGLPQPPRGSCHRSRVSPVLCPWEPSRLTPLTRPRASLTPGERRFSAFYPIQGSNLAPQSHPCAESLFKDQIDLPPHSLYVSVSCFVPSFLQETLAEVDLLSGAVPPCGLRRVKE